jgi:hypothetical protein
MMLPLCELFIFENEKQARLRLLHGIAFLSW